VPLLLNSAHPVIHQSYDRRRAEQVSRLAMVANHRAALSILLKQRNGGLSILLNQQRNGG